MALLDVRELIGMAVKDEETGVAFYDALAGATAQAGLKEKLLAISKQEQGHRDRFKKMLDEIGDYKPMEEYEGEYEGYVSSLLKTRAFPEPAEAAAKAKAVGSSTEALDIALQMERDTLLFLSEMKNFVDTKLQKYISAIIQEERDHVVQLTDLKKTL